GRRPPVSGTAVPAGLVEPGAWVEVDDPSALRDLARRVEGYDATRRIVVVGDRGGGLDCSASGVIELADAYEIRLVFADSEAPRDGHGCAFVLPRDGKPVHVAGTRPDR
ncbi:MAG TPA: hypothetical protein VLE71_00405, partial [Actinomycetota bacterium]|nr:hypothetical protein [Actinomycetota bacterium]